MSQFEKVGFGGGCHWCTEAVFQQLKGVDIVEQGYIASSGDYNSFSEAVIVHFDPALISLAVLCEIHLHTHKSTVMHSMRTKYRSAIYSFSEIQQAELEEILINLQLNFDGQLITEVLPFDAFNPSREQIQNYYQKNPNKPFCKTFIDPKLQLIQEQFSDFTTEKTIIH